MSNELYRDFLDRKLDDVIDAINNNGSDIVDAINQNIDFLIDGSITKISTFVNTLRPFAFANCVNLTEVDIPNVTTLTQGCFQNCTSLVKMDFPNITRISSSNTFYQCTSLKEVIFYDINGITTGTFYGCTLFDTLVIKKSSMATLQVTQALTNTQFWSNGNGGKLYVPQALITTYQNNQTWSDLLALNANNQILAIEGSPYDN